MEEQMVKFIQTTKHSNGNLAHRFLGITLQIDSGLPNATGVLKAVSEEFVKEVHEVVENSFKEKRKEKEKEFRNACVRSKINSAQSEEIVKATREAKARKTGCRVVNFVCEELSKIKDVNEAVRKVKKRVSEEGRTVSDILNGRSAKMQDLSSTAVFRHIHGGGGEMQDLSGSSGVHETKPSSVADPFLFKKIMKELAGRPHQYTEMVRQFCFHYKMEMPEFEIVRENDVFLCTAMFRGMNFVSSYEYEKQDCKDVACKKIVEHISRSWATIFGG